MNYQKILSRLYSSAEHANGELFQKCSVITGNIANFSQIASEENTSSDVDNQTESGEFIEYRQSMDQVEEVMFVNASANDDSQSWIIPSPEDSEITVEPLTPEEVRWFYKLKDDKIWTEFNGYDSLLIEEKYKTLPPLPNEEIQSPILPNEEFNSTIKGKEEDEHFNNDDSSSSANFICSGFGSFKKKGKFRKRVDRNEDAESSDHASPTKKRYESKKSNESSEDSFEGESSVKGDRIVVRGGLYEVDVARMLCESIYWPGESYVITRGLYFYDGNWQPLERCHGEILEVEHLRLFGHKTISDVNKSANIPPGVAVHCQHFSQFHVEWMSSLEIYLYWGGAPRQLVRSVTQKLGFYQSTGYRLRRGYRTQASKVEKPPDITHVVFVIHGIGQKMDEGRIIRNTNCLRGICEWLRIHHPCSGSGRAELFPARWRAGARGRASGLLQDAAPPGAPALRRAINEAAMDVMYYTSPLYGKQVQDDLRRELNRLYTMFMDRNPQFNGHFSAVAHSLGSVILYDIIIDYQLGCKHCAGTKNQPKQGLLFPLQQLFCLGSPLSVFLAMRHTNPSLSAVLPEEFTPRLFNIFHLSDPVAYRLEPLISRYHANQPPVIIQPYHASPMNNVNPSSPAKGPWRLWSYVKHPWQRPSDEVLKPNSESVLQTPNDSPSRFKDNKPIVVEENNPVQLLEEKNLDSESETVVCCSKKPISPDKKKKENEAHSKNIDTPLKNDEDKEKSINRRKSSKCIKDTDENEDELLPYRLDYTLRDTGMANNYLSAITSHTSYWNNYDVAHFILSNLYPEIECDEETKV